MNLNQKIKKLRTLLRKSKANQIILKSEDPNFFWLFQKQSKGAIAVIKNEEIIFVKKLLEDFSSELINKKTKLITIEKKKDLQIITRKIIKGKTLTNHDLITLNDEKLLNIKKSEDISFELQGIRAVKSEEEIRRIKTACKHTTKCWAILLKKIKKNLKTEIQISNFIKKYALEKELELAFEPVVASGKNAGVPHHVPRKTLNQGFLIIDFGFSYKGYKSDMTRTIYLGNPSKKEKQIYNELLRVQETMIKKLAKTKKASHLYEETLKIMKQPELFIHGLGHGVGIEIHEKPSIKPESKDAIQKNQALTIEPGYYTKKYGIRIEDTIILKEKPIILTNASKKLKILR